MIKLLRIKYLLALAVLLLIFQPGCGVQLTPTPTPTASPTYFLPELEYRLIDKYPDLFW
ncbi:MAG: hypothetical protein Q7R57_06210 [Dehalococcoidales bacterium]|nr:hypothetical protein [Dehalococcoidales bacterium]